MPHHDTDKISNGGVLPGGFATACMGFIGASMLLFPLASARAQTGTSARQSTDFKGWDVISVKPNKSSSGNMQFTTDDTYFRAENVTVKMLLVNGYGIREALISGLPAWAGNSRWDINAKLVDPSPELKNRKQSQKEAEDEFHAQTKAILTYSFHLQAHTETRVQPTYDLVVAGDGPKLKKPDPSEVGHGSANWSDTTMTATAVPLREFARMIEGEAGRNVTDKTGLSGNFNYQLRWTRAEQAANATDSGATDQPPDFFTALQEQLGLKLVPDKGPVTTLVIDSLEMPVED